MTESNRNKRNALVSVVMPAYNHERYIVSAIDSIVSQTYSPIELLIIDDGSIDQTWEKIQFCKNKYDQRFIRFFIYKQKNMGTSYTLSQLINKSKGKFIFFLASDDLVKPSSIEIQVNFLANNPNYCLVVGDNEIIDNRSRRVYWDEKRNIVGRENAKYKTFVEFLNNKNPYFFKKTFGSYATLFKENYIPNGYLISKTALTKIGELPNIKLLEDWYIMLQLSKYYKFKYINTILYSYRWHSNNSIKKITRMKDYAIKTKKAELSVLNKMNFSNCFSEVYDIAKNGLRIWSFGYKFFFRFEKYRKYFTSIYKIYFLSFCFIIRKAKKN
jgi:alpha-1,3-rhamnosyltransferase